MSSKWNRPMRQFRPALLVCQTCGQPVRSGGLGGWTHVRKLLLRDWHPVKL